MQRHEQGIQLGQPILQAQFVEDLLVALVEAGATVFTGAGDPGEALIVESPLPVSRLRQLLLLFTAIRTVEHRDGVGLAGIGPVEVAVVSMRIEKSEAFGGNSVFGGGPHCRNLLSVNR